MLAIRLEKELEEQIDLLAKVKQSNRSAVVREAVIRYLEDNEDLELARQALAQTKGGKSLKDLRRDLGLEVEISDVAEKQLHRLDRLVQKRLLDWLNDRIEGCKEPRHFGEALRGDLSGLWRYRVGDYRIICQIHDDRLVVLALAVGRRREVYRS